jgi:hypothetical protein
MFKLTNAPALLFCLLSFSTNAAEQVKQPSQSPTPGRQCTSEPCANTLTGEDPSEIAEREGRARSDQIRKSADDKVRWKRIRIYSDSNDPQRLQMNVHNQGTLSMLLDPRSGNLTFRGPAVSHTFNVAAPGNASDNPCPIYNLQVIDASADHAVVKKTCPMFEYKPGKEYKSYDYFLYDPKTASMREIWSASAIDNVSQLEAPRPEPIVAKLPNGYQFKWNGTVSSGGKPSNRSYNLMFLQERDKRGKLELICRDLAAPKSEQSAGGCEGAGLPLVNQSAK